MEMLQKRSNKFFMGISCVIYLCGFMLAFLIMKLLNLKMGLLQFNNYVGTFQSIFIHNAVINLIVIAGGFLCSIPTVITLFFNGVIMGNLMAQSIIQENLMAFITNVLPHGIIEIPTFVFCGCIAFQITQRIVVRGLHLSKSFAIEIVRQIIISLILLLIAAVIESI